MTTAGTTPADAALPRRPVSILASLAEWNDERLTRRALRRLSRHELGDFRASSGGLRKAGFYPEAVTHDDIAGADEFHVGGAEATAALVEQLGITPELHVLDVGTGVGGPARHVADRYGCRVTGVDLTPEFVEVRKYLEEDVEAQLQIQGHRWVPPASWV